MKICVAQTRPIKGNIQRNIENHKRIIGLALAKGADTIIFPELSVTGYEPELANELATSPEDDRFDEFQKISDISQVTIGVGVPIKNNMGISITMVLFRPHQPRQTYAKKYLHADEEPYFASGEGSVGFIGEKKNVALAICYEIFIPEHAETAFKNGAEMYIASVAKSVKGMDKAIERLAQIAEEYTITVFMANCVGYCDNFECGGKTSVWNKKGLLQGQLNDTSEGILILDTDTQELIQKTL